MTGWELNVMTLDDANAKQATESESVVQVFMKDLDVDEEIAQVLAEEGFSSLEEIAYVPLEEMLAIEGFDEDIVNELRQRAKDALITRALASEEKLEGSEPAEDLLSMEGMDRATAFALAAKGVRTMEELAEQAVDDIMDIEAMTEERAGVLIMEARKPWFAAQQG